MDDTVTLDVRPFHARGEEPFSAIMEAVDGLCRGQSFLLINSFEPVPLYAIMRQRGFDYRCEEKNPEEFHVLFAPR